eukprot:362178-Chlamydomonas_euryale.AAC.5
MLQARGTLSTPTAQGTPPSHMHRGCPCPQRCKHEHPLHAAWAGLNLNAASTSTPCTPHARGIPSTLQARAVGAKS